MKTWILGAIFASTLALLGTTSAQAGLQVGGGVLYLNPTDSGEDDGLIGGNLEIGLFESLLFVGD